MTEQEQRIAIAEACGWVWKYGHPKHSNKMSELAYWFKSDTPPLGGVPFRKLPDYPNDLNAMHSAEEETVWKDEELWKKYISELAKLSDSLAPALHATAAQRAEAFLRTMGKWRD